MRDPAKELRLVVGKLALLLAFVYVLVLVAALVGVTKGGGVSVVGWVLLLLPAAAFVVSSRDAIKLHQISDTDHAKASLKRCSLYAGIGVGLLIVVGLALDNVK